MNQPNLSRSDNIIAWLAAGVLVVVGVASMVIQILDLVGVLRG